MAGVIGIHSLKKEYESFGQTVNIGTLAHILMRSNQHRGPSFSEVQTGNVIIGQEGKLGEKSDFQNRFSNAYKSNTIVADLRKGKSSPRSINISGSAFDGVCVNEKNLQDFYGDKNLNGYQILSKVLIKNPKDDPYGAIDIYSNYMRGNMVIQTDNGFVAIRGSTVQAPLFMAIHPDSDLYMVSSENCSESMFLNSISENSETTFKDVLNIDGNIFEEVEPGTIIRAENGKAKIFHSDKTKAQLNPHELVYTMHPASTFKKKPIGVYWRGRIGEEIGRSNKDKLSDYDVVFPIPDSPRPIAKGIWNQIKKYGTDIDEYLVSIDRSTSGLKQQRDINREEFEKFDKIGAEDIVKGKKVIIVEDSLLTGRSLLGTVSQLDAHKAAGYCFVTGQPPIINEEQIGIKSRKKYLVSREIFFGSRSMTESNERITKFFGKMFPKIDIIQNTLHNLSKALDVEEDDIWSPQDIRIPVSVK